ncbi:cyclohexanecarboxylate-CoA ligase [Dietzia sp. NCCP-2495]|uniref:class I adenylate-forming enzyme family protein n=1 Tax=Dietzia sp. NCCP-2495 TaxID=2934675 RepID=UPI0022312354|nr:class I adenylate-forming enzyme family protein [Dietzia sp. NCCP-2495]GLB63414.1 cyclohexanecarboxylate-CoA ligase [Dietzia sp. NCCP-2495]
MTDSASVPVGDSLDDFTLAPEKFAEVSVSGMVRHWARTRADDPAYIDTEGILSWSGYDRAADLVYAALVPEDGSDAPGSAAVYLPDTAGFHIALVGAYRAGVRVAAMGARSGPAEIAHIMSTAGARVLVTAPSIRGRSVGELLDDLESRGLGLDAVIIVDGTEIVSGHGPVVRREVDPSRAFGVDEISMLNSTSGTTGRPKLVTQTQRRWVAFAGVACRKGELDRDETIAAFVPAPFGFGLWTSHFLPALMGRPTLVMDRFDASVAISLMRDHGATVLACVSTQFRMMLHSEHPPLSEHTSLRVMYTGGEAVPTTEARRFEEITGARALQFYGSNETGAASATSIHDDDETRLATGGYLLPEMQVRVFDGGREIPGPGLRRGQPAVRGPLMSRGYWNDDAANAELFTDDGWILLGDVVEVDESDRLRVVGRIADLIIRGGKNISAVEVEDHVREHPAVAMVAAVGVPDPLFGERLCVVVTLRSGADDLSLPDLTTWLRDRGVTREYLPERLLVVDSLPTAPGGKIAKGEVRGLAEAATTDATATDATTTESGDL